MSRGKERVSETEENTIVSIPMIVRLRPIVVEPATVLVGVEIEDVRIPVGIGFVRRAV